MEAKDIFIYIKGIFIFIIFFFPTYRAKNKEIKIMHMLIQDAKKLSEFLALQNIHKTEFPADI